MAKAKSIGGLIDSLYKAREQRIAAQREIDDMKVAERELQKRVMEELNKLGASKLSGSVATASIQWSTVPRVADWDKLYTYIHKNKAFYLLHQRIASKAWAEVVDTGKTVPGVEGVTVEELSLTKASKGK